MCWFGQQQRVAIVCALAPDAKVLPADEPTENRDEDTAREIADSLVKIAHELQRCVVIVTHSAELAKRADVVFSLKRGTVKALETLKTADSKGGRIMNQSKKNPIFRQICQPFFVIVT